MKISKRMLFSPFARRLKKTSDNKFIRFSFQTWLKSTHWNSQFKVYRDGRKWTTCIYLRKRYP